MKKKWKWPGIFMPGKQKIIFMMRFYLMITFFCVFNVMAVNARSQAHLNLNLKEVSLMALFQEIQNQTGVDFVYNEEQCRDFGKVSVKITNGTIEQILQQVFDSGSLTYRFEKGVIMVKAADRQTAPQAKGKRVTGNVVDSEKMPLPGVTIMLKGTTIGGVTDIDGNFKLDLPDVKDIVLIFSFIGMKNQEIHYNGGEALRIVMEKDITEIEEVVVTGVFTKAKESYTGAVTTITSKDLQKVGNRNILSSIRNIDPSFNIVEDINIGSDPNKLPNITVRGNSSLDVNVRDLQSDSRNRQSPNLPLFIMDGFEINLERMMDLDENQIESITLLKDASATAMYGTRGANGVVVITTRKPEPGKLQITYKGSLNIEAPDLSSYNLMNAREKLAYEKAAGLYETTRADNEQELIDLYNYRLREMERGVNTYWLKYPVRTGVGHRHSLRLEGGGEEFRYAAGLSYNNVAGAMKGSERNTFNGNVFLSYKYKNITFQNDLMVSFNKSKNSPYGTFNDFAKVNSYWKPYDDEGNLVKKLEDDQSYDSLYGKVGDNSRTSNTVYNPLWNALQPSIDESKYTQIQNNFAIEWYILPELFVRGRVGITAQNNRLDKYISAENTKFDSYTGSDLGREGTYSYGTGDDFSYEAEFTLNYSKTLAEKHQVYLGAGYNFAQDKTEYYEIKAEGISNPNMDFLGSATMYEKEGHPYGDEGISRRMGGLVNANYTYDRRYFVDLSGKLDGSSKFGADSRFAPFWSAGAGWNIHNERFMGDGNILSTARLRVSYGTSGSQEFNPYQAMTTFKTFGSNVYKGWHGVYLMAMGNSDLGWQKTHQLNVGIELDLFRGRVHLNADFYRKMTDDLLSDITLPSSSGFDTYKANVGKVMNRGVELNLNAYLIRDTERELFWSLGGTLAHNKNEIKKISNSLQFLNKTMLKEDSTNPSFLYEEGQSMNTIFVVQSRGIDPSNGQEIFVKRDGTLTYTWDAADKIPYGISEPKIWGNLNTMLRYKGFNFNAVFGYRYGGQMYNSTLVNKVENILPYENADRRAYYDRWKNPGENARYKGVRDFSTTKASTRFVMDENTLECRSLSLGYEWQTEWLKRNLNISYLSLTGYTEDVFRISTIKQERGLSYPFARKFSLSLMVRF